MTVQRPKGGVPHPENQQEMALRKSTAPDDYAVQERVSVKSEVKNEK